MCFTGVILKYDTKIAEIKLTVFIAMHSAVRALIVDESTDLSVTKFMGLCVRYFSVLQKRW